MIAGDALMQRLVEHDAFRPVRSSARGSVSDCTFPSHGPLGDTCLQALARWQRAQREEQLVRTRLELARSSHQHALAARLLAELEGVSARAGQALASAIELLRTHPGVASTAAEGVANALLAWQSAEQQAQQLSAALARAWEAFDARTAGPPSAELIGQASRLRFVAQMRLAIAQRMLIARAPDDA